MSEPKTKLSERDYEILLKWTKDEPKTSIFGVEDTELTKKELILCIRLLRKEAREGIHI